MCASRKYLRHLGFVLILALLLAALCGCEVGPNYKKPPDVVPAQYAELSTPTTQGSRVTSETTQLAQWWSSFRDPELDSLVERALGSNLDLQQAQSRIVQSRYELGIARAPLFPNVTATGGYEYARGSKNITIPAGAFTGGAGAAPAAATPGVATPAARRRGRPPGRSRAAHRRPIRRRAACLPAARKAHWGSADYRASIRMSIKPGSTRHGNWICSAAPGETSRPPAPTSRQPSRTAGRK